MINIESATLYNAYFMDTALKGAINSAIGVSTGGYGTILHLPDDASVVQRERAQALFDNAGGLNLVASATVLNEGDADPTISCNDAVLSADSNVGYVVVLDGESYSSGTDTVTAGAVSLTLVDPVAGVYDVYIYRLSGTYAWGSVQITVNEV